VRALLVLAALLAACAQAPAPAPGEGGVREEGRAAPEESVVPGTIGVTVRQEGSAVVVSAVRRGSEVRVGDVVLRYNGAPVASPRQFYRLVVDSAPGSRARLEVLRDGGARTLEVPVQELDVMPRA
jgi:S1-C subfamily serine protease